MSNGSMAGSNLRYETSLLGRVRSLIDGGMSKADVMDLLVDEGANPGTVEGYLREFHTSGAQSDWIDRARDACEAHLADLYREHGLRSEART